MKKLFFLIFVIGATVSIMISCSESEHDDVIAPLGQNDESSLIRSEVDAVDAAIDAYNQLYGDSHMLSRASEFEVRYWTLISPAQSKMTFM